MRLKSEIWVKAYLRRCASAGVDAVLVRRGDGDAGVVYIKISRLDGTASLFGPAPAGLEGAREDRQFQSSFSREVVPEAEADAYLSRQIGHDADIWVIAVEDRQGRHFLEDWLASP
jgi:hypothetical protein